MDLYLKIDKPSGKRFRIWKNSARVEFHKEEFVLYPHKPTEVPDKFAKILLEQDPHLVGTKLHENYNKNPLDDQPTLDEMKEVLKELFVVEDFETLTSKAIIEYGNRMCIKIPKNKKKDEQAKMLEERCAEIAEL